MSRVKILVLSLLAVCAVSSVVVATASAALQGPWYRHPEAKGSQKQIKYPYNEEQPFVAENEGAFTLKGKILGTRVVISCAKAASSGNIWDGLQQGEDNAKVEFTECTISEAVLCKGAKVLVSPAEVYSELQWKYAGTQKELTEVGQQKIYDVFAPTKEPEQKEGVARAVFTEIEIPEKECKTLHGIFPVEAAGSLATFQDQHQVSHKIVWGTAAQVEPQNEDVVVGRLTWKIPNVTGLHHQESQTKAKLLFASEPAELEGTLKVALVSEEPFGAYNI
jgi:hypothetical protein